MLQTIRDKITGWVAAIFLGAIAVVFVFWGIDFQSNSGNYAVKVNGESVPVQKVQRAWQQNLSRLQQMMQGEVPPEFMKAQQNSLMERFIEQSLLQQRAEEFGYQVSDEMLAKRVRDMPEFQVEGKFSADRYNELLSGAGYTTAQFEAELETETLISQLQEGLVDSSFVLPYELDRRYTLERQEREIDYALIPASDFASEVQITEEKLQAWYEEHKSEYMSPETVDVEYLEVTRAMAEARVQVDETQLREYFESVKDRFETPERRRASHILITTGEGVDEAAAEKRAAELAAQAKSGANFEALAKEHSKDPGSAQKGGDLDWATRGMFVGPFEDALFAMSKGEIRGPIKTQFGYHVLRLDDIDSSQLKSFEEARPELEAEFRRERSEAIFSDESTKLDEQSFAALTTLEPVAKALGLPIQRVVAFTREGGGELGADPEVIKAAFSEDVLERGQNSPIIAVGDDRAVVLRVANHKPAAARPLAEVRQQVEERLRTETMRNAAQKRGAEAVARLQKGESWSAVAADLKLNSVGRRFVTRQDQVVPQPVLREAFQVGRAQVSEAKPFVGGVVTDDGNYAVFSVTAVRAPTVATEPTQQKQNRQRQTERQLGNEELAAYVAEAKRTAKISRNDRIFE